MHQSSNFTMMQELLIKGEQNPKLSITSIPALDGSPSSSPSPAAAESLRCPRCDSPNTKFCYYNNYNLTQPRHFCKTCRRYWTKGGALRNVPIGGGCRKSKTASIAGGKLKSLSSGLITAHHHPANPNLMWAPPQNNNNHFLSLLRANQNPNRNYTDNNNFWVSGLDLTFRPGPAGSPLHRSQTNHGGEAQYNGLQDMYYHRVKSSPSTSCYFPENDAPVIGNTNSAILESGPAVTAGELGFWNANHLSFC